MPYVVDAADQRQLQWKGVISGLIPMIKDLVQKFAPYEEDSHIGTV